MPARWIRIIGREWTAVVALALVTLVGCAATPAPTAPPGRIAVTVAPIGGENPLFAPVYRARAVSADGAVDAAWRMIEGGPPVEVPPGRYRLEAFTTYLSDTIVCGRPIAEPTAVQSCFQPTLEPGGPPCAVDIEVPPSGEVRLVFQQLPEGRCKLLVGDARPT